MRIRSGKMENEFKIYLINQGYKEFTPSGNKSTVYDYIMRVNRILQWENLSWNELAENIAIIVSKYDIGGENEDIGKKSHNAYICALRAYQQFIKSVE